MNRPGHPARLLVPLWILLPVCSNAAEPDGRGQPLQAGIAVDAGQEIRTIPRTLFGANVEWKWDGNGIWDAKARRLDEAIVGLTRQMGVQLLRYPGGTMADYYRWRDGIGPLDRRPAREPLPGDSGLPLLFGTDEALDFARRTEASLLVTVNMVTGTAAEAADWVKHVRAAGRVAFWQLGNENYIQGAPGAPAVFTTSALSAAEYVKRARAWSTAMRAADPQIRLIGILDPDPRGPWNRTVLPGIAGLVQYVSIHNGYAPGFAIPADADVRQLYRALFARPTQARQELAAFSDLLQSPVAGPASRLKIAVTEWGPIFSVDTKSPFYNHTQTLGSALYAAGVLMAMIDSPRTEIACFWQLVDQLQMGWIGQRGGQQILKPTALAFELFTRHLGPVLVKSTVNSPTFDSPARYERIAPAAKVPWLEALATVDKQRGRLCILAVNRSFDAPIDAELVLDGFSPAPAAAAWVLTGTGVDANLGAELFQAPGLHWPPQAQDPANPRYAKGGPAEVQLTRSQITAAPRFRHTFGPHSVTVIELDHAK